MSQKIYTDLDIKGNTTIGSIANATTDTDKFLVSDNGLVKYRTGAEMLSDLGVAPGVVSNVQHQVKAEVAINKGQAVYVTSADGTNIIVGLASNTSEATSSKTMGLLDSTVAINGFANVITEGLLAGLNTIGATAGDPVWLGADGNLIYGLINKPYAPAHLVFIGIVTRVNASNGEIFVKVQNGFELNEIHDIDLKTTTPVNGDILGFNGTLWVNKTIAAWLGYTPANASGTTNYVSKFTGTNTLGNSQIFDNGTNVGIGTTTPSARLNVRAQGALSTDIAFRVRNSTDTQNFLVVNGAGDVFNNGAGGVNTNTFFGENVGRSTTGAYNTAIGRDALLNNTTGVNNTVIGLSALLNNTTGVNNTVIGSSALRNNTTGSSNTVIGENAGRYISGGSHHTITNNSVFIGRDTRALADNQTNQIVIGDSAIGLGSNSVVLGNSSITRTRLQGQVIMGSFATAPTGIEGAIYYNSTVKKHYGFNGTTWNALY